MDRTNILEVFDGVQVAHPEWKFLLTFLGDTAFREEPTVKVSVRNEQNVNITYYITEAECQEITVDEMSEDISFLIQQEVYRRLNIFSQVVARELDDNSYKE